ncbi:MAG: hypothetical protein LBC02_11995 [Planctomycetaceae bacterium]|nr:hypothetical protein [Planctomycetaceae bacterium]
MFGQQLVLPTGWYLISVHPQGQSWLCRRDFSAKNRLPRNNQENFFYLIPCGHFTSLRSRLPCFICTNERTSNYG